MIHDPLHLLPAEVQLVFGHVVVVSSPVFSTAVLMVDVVDVNPVVGHWQMMMMGVQVVQPVQGVEDGYD